MERYWVSWVHPTEDFRPLNYPPNEAILGWWCSGYDSEEKAIICAVVQGENQEAVEVAIEEEWPEVAEVLEWRFFDSV